MRRILSRISISILLLSISGCSGIEPPMPGKLLTHPLGTTPLHNGMTKDEVKNIWGNPDLISPLGESKDAGPTQKEEWLYYGRMTNLPISYANLSKTMHLYFDGNNLTDFKEER